jgi:RNase H-fold protein (predicted Holliday junction resolvase)
MINHRIYEDLQMSTVLSEIKKRNTKYLRKLENHTNAVAVNLADNREKTHRLKHTLYQTDLSKTPIQQLN